MTKGLASELGIPTLEEILQETSGEAEETEEGVVGYEAEGGHEEGEEAPQGKALEVASKVHDLITHHELKAATHGKKMDALHTEVLQHARQVAELGFDLDPARAPRMFEVANQLYKTALDAESSKRDAELKLFQLVQNQRKLELEEKKVNKELGVIGDASEASVVVIEDRNALLRRLREEK